MEGDQRLDWKRAIGGPALVDVSRKCEAAPWHPIEFDALVALRQQGETIGLPTRRAAPL